MKNYYIILFAILAGYIGGFAGQIFFKSTDFVVSEYSYIEESQIISAVEKVSPSVVSILDNNGIGGTGFIVSDDGLVLTNKHVSQGKSFEVVLSNGEEYKAKFISEDPFDDVAVLRMVSDKKDFPVVQFGDSNDVVVGQKVFAIGNALAVYGNSVTSGIISGKGRALTAYSEMIGMSANFNDLFQTDAAINLGNSGGPLLNLKGEVIAMNVALAEAADNVGFAIPINDIKGAIESVKKNGKIVRPVLGVNFLMLSENEAKQIDQTLSHGALLVNAGFNSGGAVIKGQASDLAGIMERDVILKIDSENVDLKNPLHKIIKKYQPGDKIVVEVFRGGKILNFDVVLGSSNDLK